MWTKEQAKRWREKHASSCVDCGNFCSPTAKRCKHCEGKRRMVNPVPKFCPDCGKPINQSEKKHSPKWAAKHCRSCASKQSWKRGERRAILLRQKEGRAKLRQGRRYKGSGGYIRTYMPNHPRSDKKGLVLEHILVWEGTHSKPLPKGWIIHHLNGIKHDNRPLNLVALPNKKHYLVLQAKAKRIQELEALLNNQHQLL